LSKQNKELYERILNLPFISRRDKFDETIKELKKPKVLNQNQANYLESKLKIQDKWAKCIIQEKVTIGVSTTSRIESMHSVLAEKLNSNSRLNEVFDVFRKIENSQIIKFKEEFRKQKNNENPQAFQGQLMQMLAKIYTPYPLKKLENKFLKSLSYEYVEEKKDCEW